MLDAVIFRTHLNVVPSETIGVGIHRFDFYIQRGSMVNKFVVMATDYRDAISTFCARFSLGCKTKRKVQSNGVVGYRVYFTPYMNPRVYAFDDAIVKMIN